ncbi:MAG: hypothetical protein ACXWE4_09175, partial [Methylobacter sp.]
TPAVFAQQSTWYVFSREDGCSDLQVLAKVEKLSRTPESPDDFAQMLRERGESATIGKSSGFPAELTGQVVQVNVGSSKAAHFRERRGLPQHRQIKLEKAVVKKHCREGRMKVLVTAMTYMISLVAVVVVTLYVVIVLAGSHAGLLPGWMETVVLVIGWLVVLFLLNTWGSGRFLGIAEDAQYLAGVIHDQLETAQSQTCSSRRQAVA